MADREKVIAALTACARGDVTIDCKQARCPYWDEDENCTGKMARDTLELLKGQEPRVLTIEELTGDDECWFEGINGAYGYADCYMCTGSREVEVHRISMKPEYVSWDDFGKKWRCWSYRPTDEQRKAVKWDAAD